MNFITFKIELTETTIQGKIIKDTKEEYIQLDFGIFEYPLTIEFNNNEIKVCQDEINDNTITGFVSQLFNNPTEYKRYEIEYQNKRYELLPETLLVLIINEFKKLVDKKGIVNRFLFKSSNTNKDVLQRIKSSLINIGIPNNFTQIKHRHKERESFYVDEEYLIYEILQKEKEYHRFIKDIKRAKQIIKRTTNQELQQKEYLLNEITNYNEFYSEDNWRKFKYNFTCKEKRELQLHHLDNTYCIFLASKYFETIDDFINIEMTSSKFINNTEKFFYSPIPLTKQTRKFFPMLQTLVHYFPDDEIFINDKRIIARQIPLVPYYLTTQEKNQLEKWTGLQCSEILFDSNVDDWENDEGELNKRILGKKQLIFLIEDDDIHEKFGYYMNREIIEKYWHKISADTESFYFNLQSNGRIEQPKKFAIKDINNEGILLHNPKDNICCIHLGKIILNTRCSPVLSFITDNCGPRFYSSFDVTDALYFDESKDNPFEFFIKRFLVIQMK